MTTNNEEEFHICGETGGEIKYMSGCGKKALCDDTCMIGNTSFCIECFEKYQEEGLANSTDEEDCDICSECDICEVCSTPKCIYCGLCDCYDC